MQTYQLSDTRVNVNIYVFRRLCFKDLLFHVCVLLMASLCCYLFKRLLNVAYDQWGNGMTVFPRVKVI